MTGGLIKVYISSISSNREHRNQQQHIINILESHKVDFETVDITDPAQTEAKQFMRENSVALHEGKTPLPPQIFNEDNYCGNYTMFSEALEDGELFQFLKLAAKVEKSDAQIIVTGGRAPEDDQAASEQQEKPEDGSGDAN